MTERKIEKYTLEFHASRMIKVLESENGACMGCPSQHGLFAGAGPIDICADVDAAHGGSLGSSVHIDVCNMCCAFVGLEGAPVVHAINSVQQRQLSVHG
jgi:hypothetical protein